MVQMSVFLKVRWALTFLLIASGSVLTSPSATAAEMQWTAHWTPPTPEELSMTAQPEVPGASAVYLFREEQTVDYLHTYTVYERIKILSEGGRDRANVELKYQSGGEMDYSVSHIEGRTVHPDGKIIPFVGKPYERVVMKSHGYKEKAKVFTLPDVTVGSIVEYRYILQWDDSYVVAPRWTVQNDLYLRKGHFSWLPLDDQLTQEDGTLTKAVAWKAVLPGGAEVKTKPVPNGPMSHGRGHATIELNVENIPPLPEEEYMPPAASVGFRVMFYYTAYTRPGDFWKATGTNWSKASDKFVGPGSAVGAAVQQLASGVDTQEQKLKKIYAAVEELENTDYTREHSRVEDKAEGLSKIKTTDDVWLRRRGSSDQITELFVAMARAAGLHAYLMDVTNRDKRLFLQDYQSLDQLDDDIAIVQVDGKERFFDPGSRYCQFGHLAWKHTNTGGLRQTDSGAALAVTPGETYLDNVVDRVANLKMDPAGNVSGIVDLTFNGSPALRWRQKALTDDEETVEREMKESVEEMLPDGAEVKVVSMGKLAEYEGPLAVKLEIKGPAGSATGKRLLIPGDLFETRSKGTFAHEKREQQVWFSYRYSARDAIRIVLPDGYQVESVPSDGVVKYPKMASYKMAAVADAKAVTVHRDLYLAEIFYRPDEYPDLRRFYSDFEARDREPVVLKLASTPVGN